MPTKRTTKKENPGPGAGAAPALKRKRGPKAAAAAASADAVPQALAALSEEFTASEREAIERLAYSYWQERGCRGGSAEEDWFRAEAEVLGRRAQAG